MTELNSTSIEFMVKKYEPECRRELVGDWRPIDALRLRLRDLSKPKDMRKLGDDENSFSFKGDCAVLYSLVRALEPDVVVETGVQNGMNTELILGAMEVNGNGRLISIDCGSIKCEGISHDTFDGVPGKYVREELKHRWDLRVGDAKIELPKVIEELKNNDEKVTLFYHDSDHSTDHVNFELNSIKDVMGEKGIMLMHDRMGRIFDIEKNGEFREFAAMNNSSTNVWCK